MNKKKKNKHVRKKAKNFTLEDVLELIDDTIDEMLNNPRMLSYDYFMVERGMYDALMHHWRKNYPEVDSAMEYLQAVRLAKYNNFVTADDRSNNTVNPTRLIWYGKCSLGLVEAQHLLQLKQDADIARGDINKVGFAEDDDE